MNNRVEELWLGQGTIQSIPSRKWMILVEIYESYDSVRGESHGFHYRNHDLLHGHDLGVKCIGYLGLDEMREFAKRYSIPPGFDEDNFEWRKLR